MGIRISDRRKCVRVAIIGQQDFGKSVLEAMLARGDTVAGVFCAPEKPGERADPLRTAAEQQQIPVYQLPSLKTSDAFDALRGLDIELGVMAYVLQFVPQTFAKVPRHGMIQYHPSLLPRYRGPSSINWPIIRGEERTGLTIFRPNDGLDEGPVILQKETPIGPDDTLGSVYFDRLFPMGVAALLEAADVVVGGGAREIVQDESQASYLGWCRAAESHINWHNHIDLTYNLIRGCNPAPGAWTTLDGKQLKIFDAKPLPAKDPKGIAGKVGEIAVVEADGFTVVCADGRFKVTRVQPADGKKIEAGEWAKSVNLQPKARFT
jgi:methionyl-tRNA formyltransferase